VLVALPAPLADAATVGLPADADAVAELVLANFRANGGYGADNLVAGDKRIAADAPIIVDEVDIGVTDAAMGDFDLDLAGLEFTGIVLLLDQLCAGGVDRQAVDLPC